MATARKKEPSVGLDENGVSDFNTLLSAANNAYARLTPAEKESHKRRRACSFVFGNLLLSGWQGTYKDIEAAYDARLANLH